MKQFARLEGAFFPGKAHQRAPGFRTGRRTALCLSRTRARRLRPKPAEIMTAGPPGDAALQAAFGRCRQERKPAA